MRKTFLSIFLALIASIGTIFAASGTCGENLTWNLTDGVLTISGTGAMTDYDYAYRAPWKDYNSSITSVIIGDGVTSIGWYAFWSCSGLTSVTIGNSVTSIGEGAFDGCSSLTSVTIGNSVTSIGDEAFWECSGLTSVTIPNSVTSIGYYAFGACSSLTSIDVASENPNYSSVDGVLFNKDKTELIQYPIGNARTEYTIPNSVTSIGYQAFAYCSGLTSVTIPNSVTSIGDWVFAYCSGLTSVTIPNSVTWIGDYAFEYCSSLTSVTIPNSVRRIERYAFYYCTGLTSVMIPNSVINIGESAFGGCRSLTSITCEAATPPNCGGSVFYYVDKSIPLYVPAGSVATYKAAYEWKDFDDNIQPIQAPEADVTDVEANPTDNSVVIKWPAVTGATVYTINIYKGSDLICTLSFNELGQLLSISFAKKANGGNPKTAVQTATGWQFTVTSLEAGTTYDYTVTAKKEGSETPVYEQSGSFTTTGIETAIDQVTNDQSQTANKIIKDGHIFILRGEKVYTLQGQKVK